MDGKKFVFDLQRFAAVNVSGDETNGYTVGTKKITKSSEKYVIDSEVTQYDSLEAAIVAANSDIKFSVTTKSGETETTKYYDAADDFKSENLTTSDDGVSITAIKVYGDVNLQDAATVTTQITVEKTGVTLDLGANKLSINNDKSGIYVKNGASLNVTGTGSIEHTYSGISETEYNGKSTDADKGSYITDTIKKKRLYAAIQVGAGEANNRSGVELTIGNGVTVKSNSSALAVGNGSSVTVNGTVESTYSCGIYVGNCDISKTSDTYTPVSGTGDDKKLNDDIELNISGTVKSATTSNLPAIQVSGTLSYNTTTINITGGTIEYANKETLFGYKKDDNKAYGNPDAIYAGGKVDINMSSGTVTSGGTGIELRAGNLNVTGGSITSTATDYKVNKNTGATSGGQVYGAAVALSQHVTGQDVTTEISGSDTAISGQVALAVENAIAPSTASDASNTISATITGGTFESSGTGAAAIAAKAADSRSAITINGAVTFKGNIESTTIADTAATTPTITFGEYADVTVVTKQIVVDEETGAATEVEVEEKYNTNTVQFTERWQDSDGKTVSETYPVNVQTWTASHENPVGKFFYFEIDNADSKVAGDKAILAPKTITETTGGTTTTDSDDTLAITTRLKTEYASVIALDLNDTIFGSLFGENSAFTAIEAASSIPSNILHLSITGNDKITSILGSAGNDTLTAGANGSSLNGGEGSDLLIGSGDTTKAVTFIHTEGADSIQNYMHGTDLVSLGSGLIAPTSFDSVSYAGSDYVLNLSTADHADDSLTFKAKSVFSLKQADGNATISYAPGSIVSGDGVTIGSSYYTSKTFNGASDANSGFKTINGSAVEHAIRITGNDNANLIVGSKYGGTLLGGDGADSLVASSVGTFLNGGDGADSLVGYASGGNTFIYTAGADRIVNYTQDKDLVSVASGISIADATVDTSGASETKDLVIGFDSGNSLTFEGGGGSAISLKSGRTYYNFSKDGIAHGKSITLTAGYNPGNAVFNNDSAYDTVDASKVTSGITIAGTDENNYIAIGTSGGSISGGEKGNDTLVGGDGDDIFRYTAGNDVIVDFDSTKDKLDIDTPETKITKARATSRRLTFTMNDKSNLVFRSNDSIPAVISLTSGGYLTADGVVNTTAKSLNLFSSAKGKIDLGDDLYKDAAISLVSAASVKSQSVTLVGSSLGGSFTFAENNKKRDGFEYNGGNVTIGNYESGKDRINLGDYAIAAFSVTGSGETKNDVFISLSGGTGTGNTISLTSAKDSEVLIHQSTNKGNSYSKMVFDASGVMYDKVPSKATSATLWSGAGKDNGNLYSATVANKLKKITVKDSSVSGISIQAGNNNTVIDASLAGAGISLVSGNKNDKFIGSATNADTFIYTAGKDIIQDFVATSDLISLNGASEDITLSSAKITAGKKSVKFKFGNKNVLTVKGKDLNTTAISVNGAAQTFGKNSIADSSGSNVSLTSQFGGTYNTKNSKATYVDGKLVSKKLTFKGTEAAESLIGGSNKTLFKGGGGADSLVGGKGADTFFYAKGDKDTVTIANFDFDNDKLKIAGGTISKIASLSSADGGGVQFAMKKDKGADAAAVGWFDIKSKASYDNKGENTVTEDNATIDASKVAIKANNTYYWFAQSDVTLASDSLQTAKVGDLITWDKKVSASNIGSDYKVIELNYATNLVKSGVASVVSSTNTNAQPT